MINQCYKQSINVIREINQIRQRNIKWNLIDIF